MIINKDFRTICNRTVQVGGNQHSNSPLQSFGESHNRYVKIHITADMTDEKLIQRCSQNIPITLLCIQVDRQHPESIYFIDQFDKFQQQIIDQYNKAKDTAYLHSYKYSNGKIYRFHKNPFKIKSNAITIETDTPRIETKDFKFLDHILLGMHFNNLQISLVQ